MEKEPWKSPQDEEDEKEDLDWAQIVHTPCGLPIEFCECPDEDKNAI